MLLSTPATNDRGPKHMEQALAAIHQALPENAPFTLEYGEHAGRVGLALIFDPVLEPIVTTPLLASYPEAVLLPAAESPPAPDAEAWSADIVLSPDLFPILRHAQFEDLASRSFSDPIDALLRAVTPTADCLCSVRFTVSKTSLRRRSRAVAAVRRLNSPFFRSHHRLAHWYAGRITSARAWRLAWFLGILLAPYREVPREHILETSASRAHDREEDLQAASDKLACHLFDCRLTLSVQSSPHLRDQALRRLRVLAGAFGTFSRSRLATFHQGAVHRGSIARRRGRSFLISHEELATLFHPPTLSVQAEKMHSAEFRELEAPPTFCSGEEAGAVPLGRVRFRHDTRQIGLDQEARRRHVYVVGATGTGKSTLLLNLMRADMQAGRGLTMFDLHGDLSDAAIGLVPTDRTNDVIVFDASGDQVVAFNPLACSNPARVDLVTSGVVAAFRKLFDSWGPRLESLLRSATFTIVEQGGTLLDLLRLLTDEAYRERTVGRIEDDIIRAFWINEFARWNGQYRTEAVSSVTNKLLPFLSNRRLRAIVAGDPRGLLDPRQVMDREQILIVNISRGRLGQDNATLLGSLLLTSIEQAALTRADIPEGERRDHFLYLDEFQNLVTPSTAIMLSESRKYRLNLTLSHQLTRQLDEATWNAVVGNVGTMIALRVGIDDALLLAPAFSKFAGQLRSEDLANLPNYTAVARMLVAGTPSRPFTLSTLPPPVHDDSRAEIVRRASNRRGRQPNLIGLR